MRLGTSLTSSAQPRPPSSLGISWMSTPSRLKMREALAASTRHLESKDYDQAHAVCAQAAGHAAASPAS